MQEIIADGYLWFKSIHVIAIIAWMAGLLYLPRLFVYHCETTAGTAESERFKVMERKLMRFIMNPAMIAAWVFGLLTASAIDAWSSGWFHAKLLLVVFLQISHHMMASWRRAFAEDRNTHSQRFFRMVNEVPTLLMVVIVILVIVKPF